MRPFAGWYNQQLAAASDAVETIMLVMPANPARAVLEGITKQIEKADADLEAEAKGRRQ